MTLPAQTAACPTAHPTSLHTRQCTTCQLALYCDTTECTTRQLALYCDTRRLALRCLTTSCNCCAHLLLILLLPTNTNHPALKSCSRLVSAVKYNNYQFCTVTVTVASGGESPSCEYRQVLVRAPMPAIIHSSSPCYYSSHHNNAIGPVPHRSECKHTVWQ